MTAILSRVLAAVVFALIPLAYLMKFQGWWP